MSCADTDRPFFQPDELRLARRLDADFTSPDRPWGWDEDRRVFLTNDDFRERAFAWREAAQALRNRGFEAVLLHSEETLAITPALFGSWSAGLETLLTGRADREILEEVRRANPRIALGLDFERFAEPGDAVLRPVEHPMLADHPAPIDTDRVLLSLWTSGSTGEPKRVPKRLSQFFTECEAIDRTISIESGLAADETALVFATVTHQHIYGLLFRLGWPLLGRGIVTNRRHHFPEMLARAMSEAPSEEADRALPLFLISSPAHLTRFTQPELFADVRDCVALSVSSAGPLPPEGALAAYRAFGATPYEILGSTETGGIAGRRRIVTPEGDVETPDWVPTPGMTVGIEGNAEPKTGDEGLLTLTSAQLEHPTETGADRIRATKVRGGAVLAFMLLGRADRILKVEGKRFSGDAMKRAILEAARLPDGRPLFADARVLVTKREREETAVAAVLAEDALPQVLASGKSAILRDLRRVLSESFDAVTLPRRLRLVTAFPVNAQAKVTRDALLALFDETRPEWLTLTDGVADGVRTVRLTAEMRPTLEWFSGHFPDLPILPGVASLELVRRAVETLRGASAEVLSLRNLKFKSPLFPGERVILTLRFTPKEDGDDVAFTWARPPKDAWKALSDLPPNEAQMAYDRLSQNAEITAQGTLRIHFA